MPVRDTGIYLYKYIRFQELERGMLPGVPTLGSGSQRKPHIFKGNFIQSPRSVTAQLQLGTRTSSHPDPTPGCVLTDKLAAASNCTFTWVSTAKSCTPIHNKLTLLLR